MSSPVLPGDIVGGKYRVDRMLGVGGMGIVVAATHTELQQPVALKFLLAELMTGHGSTERFLREARSVARLQSEHVARVFDVGFHVEIYPYMVLELLEGRNLAQLQDEKGSLPVAEAVDYVLQALSGLSDAHAAGLIHRDLKPENLFVTRRSNGRPLVKLLDFGLAKTTGDAAKGQMSLTHVTAVMGSPLYMAPEQMRAARLADQRSDIWSMGIILYELLAGQLPFGGDSVVEIALAVSTQTPPSVLSLRPALDPALDAVVMRCLAKDPNARWQTAEELAEALLPHARGSSARFPSRATLPMITLRSRPRLAQTDVSWGDLSEPKRPAAARPAFAKGFIFGMCLSAIAVASIAFALSRHHDAPAPVVAIEPPPAPIVLPEPPTLTSAWLPVAVEPPPPPTASASPPPPPPPPKKKKLAPKPPPSAEPSELDSP